MTEEPFRTQLVAVAADGRPGGITMPDRISASTCNPTIMSCVDEPSLESRVDAPPTAQPAMESDAVGRQASSRGADFARRAAGANGGTGGAPGASRAPAEGSSTASPLWTQGACKTVVSNSVTAGPQWAPRDWPSA